MMDAWVSLLPGVVNNDREFACAARFFSADILLGSGTREWLVRIRDGRVAALLDTPRFDTPWDFALRAPEDVWERFTRALPPPLFTDIWAMRMRVPEFHWEGNTLLAARHARAVARMTELLRVSREQCVGSR
ncbi:hypothetical protein EPN42_07015 [bacterium]|nr:MAG: hypothetical protein EPN42_07015 [bacterium]